jgi:[histone H3]-lysine79 N-trimethyltransferase
MLSNKPRKDKGNVRVEKVLVKSRPKAVPKPVSKSTPARLYPSPSSGKPSSSPRLSPMPKKARLEKSTSPYPSSSDEKRKRKAASSTPRESPMPHFSSDSDSDPDEDPFRKRRKLVKDSRDPNRKSRHQSAFGDEIVDTHIISAAEIASIKKGCQPLFPTSREDDLVVELQYPSRCRRER